MIGVTTGSPTLLVALLVPAVCYGQLPSSRCDSSQIALKDCTFFTNFQPVRQKILTPNRSLLAGSAVPAEAYVVHTDFNWVVSENGVRLITLARLQAFPLPVGIGVFEDQLVESL